MEEYNIYSDIGARCGGDIYIGVVGPVRTGKSTFIKKFMELLVLPNITKEHSRIRAQDELPQSAAGRTIMTTEPKFIPNEAVEIMLSDNAKMNVRMIDCVGYIVDGAMGDTEDGQVRMVHTPWSDTEMPFGKAAEIGTEKVIREHSTIGLVITTDGSVTDIEREGYVEAEERVIRELQEINKPFIVLLNSTNPGGAKCMALKKDLEEKYGVSVMPVDCANLGAADINAIIEGVLFEFPITEISIDIPKWVTALDDENEIKKGLYNKVCENLSAIEKIRDVSPFAESIGGFEFAERAEIDSINLGNGTVKMSITAPAGLFYKVLSEGNQDSVKPMVRSIITAHYTGRTIDGKLFDSSRGGVPLACRLCDLIEGWIIAIQQMHIGDKWELYIPAEMGYGKFSQPGIPGGSTLIFEIELLGIA